MLIRNMCLVLLVVLFLPAAYAQSGKDIHTRKLPVESTGVTDVNEQRRKQLKPSNTSSGCEGETWLVTGYDYAYNTSALRQLDLVDIDGDGSLEPITVGMWRVIEGGDRRISLCKCDGENFNCISLFDTTGVFGWGSLQYCKEGPLEGNVIVMALGSGQNWIAILELDSLSIIYQGTLPISASHFVYVPDGTIWTVSDMHIYKSTDQGVNWQQVVRIGKGDPNFDSLADGPVELLIHSSPTGKYLSLVGSFEAVGISGNPDIVYRYYSTDYGNTWQGQIIGRGSGSNPEWGQVVNRDYAPYFNNFSQGNAIVDASGITHVAYNGYGEGVLPGGTDTTDVFPILYWNSRDQQWIAISDPVYEAPTDGFGNFIIENYPGNGIGQAYPTISIDESGSPVIVSWQAVEFTGNPGSSRYNIYPGDGGANGGPAYWTELLLAESWDGGVSFQPPRFLESDAGVAEVYPYAATFLEWFGNYLVMHYVYYIDPIPGTSLFPGGNSFDPNGEWIYNTKVILWVSVNEGTQINTYLLEQNYPNPFNPTTKISFSVAENSFITLKVYDVLGNEVATLVNEEKPAGSYEAEFDGSLITSGVYFYQLQAGIFIETKKMVLLR